ncbi:hypothetical protein EDB85DRAFT_2172468 [Lactarius pseudohatsudake]|nr:hypothetical protein EDB85DRAFT_2172468 [Lactarius pseudohatsudake]
MWNDFGTVTANDEWPATSVTELLEPLPNAAAICSVRLKDRLCRVLSISTSQTINKESVSPDLPATSSELPTAAPGLQGTTGDTALTATKQAKKKCTALFNSRLNALTDNISLSSTISSVLVVICKLGSIGKLAWRNSLVGITSLFKDKKEREGRDESDRKKGKKKKVHSAGLPVLYTTLKGNAEAAARAKAQEEVVVAATTMATSTSDAATATTAEHVPMTWEKNMTTAHGAPSMVCMTEDGTCVVIEDDDSASEGDIHSFRKGVKVHYLHNYITITAHGAAMLKWCHRVGSRWGQGEWVGDNDAGVEVAKGAVLRWHWWKPCSGVEVVVAAMLR